MEEKKIELKCVFCSSTRFELPSEDYKPSPGEQIKCANCGRTNDYDSLIRVAKKRAEEWAKQQLKAEFDKLTKDLKRLFK
ncbi:MAG: hypothetical protein IJQ86_03520 [Spirochaetia bacterium]|nr:hypothetical protein [Spirochaetia bacterium]